MTLHLDSSIHFFTHEVKLNLRNRTRLKSFIRQIFNKEKKKLQSINFIFTTDKRLLEINKIYLKHDFLTDIITFELNLPGKPIIAEVYISYERVKENAQIINTNLNSELHRVIFHGTLHLCGFKDKIKDDLKRMRVREDFYLTKYQKIVSRDTY